MKNIFSQNTRLYTRHKTENIFSKFDQNLKFFDAFEKKAARVGTKKCTPTSLFHIFFHDFLYLEGLYSRHKMKTFFSKKKVKKKQKKRPKLLHFAFCGVL